MMRNLPPRVGVTVAAACLMVAAVSAASAAPRKATSATPAVAGKGGRRGGAAPRKLHPVQFSCPEALDDGTLNDPGGTEALVALTSGLKWEGGYGLPGTCHRRVRLVCGPDLDHDGDRDAVLQVAWWQPNDGMSCANLNSSADYWPVTYTLLISRHQATWRALAPLAVGLFADDQELRHATEFVKLDGGQTGVQIGVVVRWSNVSSDNGCQISGHQVFAFREGMLRQLEARDDSPPCTPCCERP